MPFLSFAIFVAISVFPDAVGPMIKTTFLLNMFKREFLSVSKNDYFEISSFLAQEIQKRKIIFLDGDLGAGKTFLVSKTLEILGFKNITSPTFSIMNVYKSSDVVVYHADLYRVKNVAELTHVGIEDALENGAFIVEWPQLLLEYGIKPDISIKIEFNDELRNIFIC
jgi:tRNA threonylcarbamoyl adenosine modification protein YjeE